MLQKYKNVCFVVDKLKTNKYNKNINKKLLEVLKMKKKKEMLMELFKNDEELFNNTIEELDSYNGYLGDDRYYDMDMLPELLSSINIIDLLNMAYFGNDENFSIDNYGRKHYESFNPNRNYFYFVWYSFANFQVKFFQSLKN